MAIRSNDKEDLDKYTIELGKATYYSTYRG